MIGYILLALLNGIVIATSRVLNGRLSIDVGAFRASFWNHLVGFLFLAILLILLGDFKLYIPSTAPSFIYLGGFIGVLFVAVNSYVLPKIGTNNTVLLVISGQMVTGVIIDYLNEASNAILARFLGVLLIIYGVYLAKSSGTNKGKEHKE